MADSLLAAISLQLGDYAVIGIMLAGFGTIATSLMLANMKALGRRIDVVEARVAKVERCKAELRDSERIDKVTAELGKTKTDRHEFARENILTRQKMAKFSGHLERIEARLQAEFGIAATVKGLADELAKFREPG